KASDGDGVQLTRIIASPELDMLDPFLLLDVFGSDKPQDYIGGFPAHPHRGFETVTYMLAGEMRHQDSAGNSGVIEAGGVQWMRAGKGIIHSEMPEQEEGLLAGFQLWVNLPASHKMVEPHYQEYGKDKIPVENRRESCQISVIAGETQQGTRGIINNDLVDPIYWDIHLSAGTKFMDRIPESHNALVYVIEGALTIADSEASFMAEAPLIAKELAVLSLADQIEITAQSDSRFLLVAGKPINEPVARGGPFVMNTEEEITQAFADYKSGELA
ncbi:MAG: pirin family protein, partial [Thiotrichaceae bacterium]